MTNNFIHFGCWNRGGCPTNSNLTKVINKLNAVVNADRPQFLSICGDNYYPLKVEDKETGKKKKYLNLDELLSGFNCLPKDIPIYMTYGNHDFETGLLVNNEKENNCTLTSAEIDIAKKNPNIHLELNQTHTFGEKTKLIFLDTTYWDTDDIADNAQCYTKVDPSYNNINLVEEKELEEIEKLVEEVTNNSQIKNIIIVGHHPLAQWKLKKGKMKFSILNLKFNDFLFNNIYNRITTSINIIIYVLIYINIKLEI